ncbi:type II secretion system minor pseudopilin GspH [Thalassotalea euphylliae]|uniref:type II secretion system minor pseudopilin GspH n=1 Tax=Thalassotalea euphylliae TaxID=1655234 RepID=UPI003629979F
MPKLLKTKHYNGFTLLEVMMVIVVVGVLMSAVQFTFFGNQSQKQLQQVSERFAGAFELASEYGLLNNIELGVYFDEQSYEFVGYDGTKWTALPEAEFLAKEEMPEGISFELVLDDLPIDQPVMFDAETFRPEEENFTEKEQPIFPQIVILSGGDISPFSVTFRISDEFEAPLAYKVTGLYSTPLVIEGPLDDE